MTDTEKQLQSDHIFLRACFQQPVPRTPIWIMRQAGRYLPEYRAVREKVDFLTLCKTPELASEVTIQPIDIIGVDAAIIFSDILVVPEAMGMQLIVEEGKGGPRFPNPIRSIAQIHKLANPDPDQELRYVMDALRLTRKELQDRVPLIGFSGSPWTLASYMVEGRGSKNFRYVKEMIYNSPESAHILLEKLANSVAKYLNAQVEAGAQALQIFDTWGGILTQGAFEEFSLRYIELVISELKTPGVPIIVFCKDCGHSLQKIARTGCNVVGLDWTINIKDARYLVGNTAALQGNLDPTILYANPARIRAEVKSILANYGKGSGHIFNLGHGILPDIPVEHVKELVKAVKEESAQYHE
jgi:uroporphyrinogen decarboxylase